MSSSNAAAVRRRVGSQNNPPIPGGASIASSTPTPNNASVSTKQTGMTLQEVISHFNKKIQGLEETVTKISSTTTMNGSSTSGTSTPDTGELNTIFSEFNDRFELFAQEIALMKEQLMKLQTYTMDVNKVLYEERVRVLSNSQTENKLSSNDLETITEDIDAQTINSTTPLDESLETSSMNMMEELKTSETDGRK
jgi:hypothetical protein